MARTCTRVLALGDVRENFLRNFPRMLQMLGLTCREGSCECEYEYEYECECECECECEYEYEYECECEHMSVSM